MKSKIAIVITTLMVMLNIIPPMFTTGGIFNVKYEYINECDETIVLDGLYFDNLYYILLFLFCSFVGFTLPFLVENLNIHIKRISTLLGSWFFGGVLVELFNLSIPSEVLNSNIDNPFYFKVVICFVIGLFAIMSSETWSKQKKF